MVLIARKTKFFQFVLGIFTMKMVLFLKHILTRNVPIQHVFTIMEEDLACMCFLRRKHPLKMACFHREEPILSWTSVKMKCAGHRDVSFAPIKNQLYIDKKVEALPLPFCKFFEIFSKCQLFVNFSFLDGFHMKYLIHRMVINWYVRFWFSAFICCSQVRFIPG
jgi:hypothetical protein